MAYSVSLAWIILFAAAVGFGLWYFRARRVISRQRKEVPSDRWPVDSSGTGDSEPDQFNSKRAS